MMAMPQLMTIGNRVASDSDEYQPESKCSEYEELVDSDYENEYDDMLYENCVDHEAEWTGLKSNKQKTTTEDIRHCLDLSDLD
ncbi:unnamed protein product, partial [Ilex paraguariensis]